MKEVTPLLRCRQKMCQQRVFAAVAPESLASFAEVGFVLTLVTRRGDLLKVLVSVSHSRQFRWRCAIQEGVSEERSEYLRNNLRYPFSHL